MSMSKKVGVAVVSIIFLVALISAVPVDANKGFSVYRWWNESNVNLPPWSEENPTWIGEIWTEDGEHGNFYWFNHGAIFLGPEDDSKVQKFWGEWWIDWDDGSHIHGTHEGSFTYAISQYTINGRVTMATMQWDDLVGRKMHTVGIVDWTGGIYGIGYSEGYLQIN